MGYNDLSECTLTLDERLAEKDRIIARLLGASCRSLLSIKELDFVGHMKNAQSISVKQLFWLRDINSKY